MRKFIATARIGNDPTKYGLQVDSSAGAVDLSAVKAAPPAPARVDKVRTKSTVKPKRKTPTTTIKKKR